MNYCIFVWNSKATISFKNLLCKTSRIWKKSKIFNKNFWIRKNGKNCDSHLAHFHYRDGCLVSLRHHHFSISHPPSPPKNFAPREISSRILKYKYSKTINIPERDKKLKEELKNWFRPDFSTAFETVQTWNRTFHISTSWLKIESDF